MAGIQALRSPHGIPGGGSYGCTCHCKGKSSRAQEAEKRNCQQSMARQVLTSGIPKQTTSFSRATAIDKMEGGFRKAFLMKRADGTDVIAKVPCHIAGPLLLTTAGEVRVIGYGDSVH
jgi:hypothetical protein